MQVGMQAIVFVYGLSNGLCCGTSPFVPYIYNFNVIHMYMYTCPQAPPSFSMLDAENQESLVRKFMCDNS